MEEEEDSAYEDRRWNQGWQEACRKPETCRKAHEDRRWEGAHRKPDMEQAARLARRKEREQGGWWPVEAGPIGEGVP